MSTPQQIDSLSDTDPTQFQFDFPTEIPINIMDAYLQVVFRGQLGAESDAVVVATNDISEPTYLGISNSTDYVWINGAIHTRDEVANSQTLLNVVQDRNCVDTSQTPNQLRAGCLIPTNVDVLTALNVGADGLTQFRTGTLEPQKFVRVAYLTDADALPTFSLGGCIGSGKADLLPLQQEEIVESDGSVVDTFELMAKDRGAGAWSQMNCVLAGDGTTPPNELLPMSDLPSIAPRQILSTAPAWN
jgi:hypothetical protein